MSQAFTQLLGAIQLLALDAPEQVAALPSFVHVPDELVTTFDDQYNVAGAEPIVMQWGTQVADLLIKIRDVFDVMQETAQQSFTRESLRSDGSWQQIRTYAREVLQLLQVPVQKPPLDWIKYVPGK